MAVPRPRMMQVRKPFPFATALRHGLKNYSLETLRHDATAGLVISLIALPLSMALAIAVGLPPQHGLYTAIVAGFIAALCGGSSTQVSGPTAAFVVIIAPIVQQYGLHGLIWCEIMAGIVLIAMGLLRLGRYIEYVPHAVVTGFTAGIAVTIATISLNDFMGLGITEPAEHFIDKTAAVIAHLPRLHWPDFVVGLSALAVMVFLPKITKKIPGTIVGVIAGAGVAWALAKAGMPVDTLNTRFSYLTPEGLTLHGIQPYPPTLRWPEEKLFAFPSYAEFAPLFESALIVAALAALESLLSSTVADKMTHTKHDPDAELNGIGLANIFSGLAAGIPATGAIARTAANIHAGARTPVASAIHALLILLYVMTMAPFISMIPMAALAALLVITAWRMSHAAECVHIVRHGSRADAVILLTCFFLTVFIDMVAGVTAGMAVAGLLALKKQGKKSM